MNTQHEFSFFTHVSVHIATVVNSNSLCQKKKRENIACAYMTVIITYPLATNVKLVESKFSFWSCSSSLERKMHCTSH